MHADWEIKSLLIHYGPITAAPSFGFWPPKEGKRYPMECPGVPGRIRGVPGRVRGIPRRIGGGSGRVWRPREGPAGLGSLLQSKKYYLTFRLDQISYCITEGREGVWKGQK